MSVPWFYNTVSRWTTTLGSGVGLLLVELVHELVAKLAPKNLSGRRLGDEVDELDAAGEVLVVDGALVHELLDGLG